MHIFGECLAIEEHSSLLSTLQFLHLFKLTFILKYLKVMPAIVCCVNWSISKCQNPLSSEDEKYFLKESRRVEHKEAVHYVMCIVPYCDNTLHWILILLKKSIQYIYDGINKSIQLHIGFKLTNISREQVVYSNDFFKNG